METISIPSENEFRRWVKEAIMEYFEERKPGEKKDDHHGEPLLTRKEIAKKLQVSLVTLTDWVKYGLPSYKQRGRVYFLYSEVIEYIRANNMGPFRLRRQYEEA